MSRSVSYLQNADLIAYISGHEFNDSYDWDLFIEDITEQLQTMYPSITACDKWDDNETHIFLCNDLVEIAVAEYNGLISISLRAIDDYESWYGGPDKHGLALHWIDQIKNSFSSIGDLRKIGTFSNGESMFESITDNHTYSSKEGLCEWLEGES